MGTRLRQLLLSFLVVLFAAAAFRLARDAALADEAAKPPGTSADSRQPTPNATAAAAESDAKAAIAQAAGLERQQRYEEAIAQYLKALDISPQSVAAHNNLAWLLATCPVDRLRDGRKAVVHATKACEITQWQHPSIVDTLGIALAEAGQFDKAVELLMKCRATASASECEKIDRRLAQFRARKTYRQAEAEKASSAASSHGVVTAAARSEVQALFQQAVALEQAKKLGEAAAQYEKAVARATEVLGADSVDTAQLMVRQGDCYLHADQLEQALPLFKRALPILREKLPQIMHW